MSADQIRDRLASYLAGEIARDDFEDWFVRYTWNVHQLGTAETQELVYAIEAKLAEHSAGHIDEAALRGELAPLVTSYTPQLSVDWASVAYIGTASNIIAQVEVPFAFALSQRADESRVEEFSSR